MSAGTIQGSQFGTLLLWRVGVEDESQNELHKIRSGLLLPERDSRKRNPCVSVQPSALQEQPLHFPFI